jgi:prepilin-type N-terminal cleavage/methylation domain-containing protein
MRKEMFRAKRPQTERKNEKGFTLIEVIVAIAILSFGILAIASMQVSSMRGNAFAAATTEGATWAGDQVEKLANLPWDDALIQDADGDGAAGLDDIGFDDDPGTQADADHGVTQGGYTIQWNVVDNAVINNTKTISVIVTWTYRSDQKRVTVQRVIPRIT